MSNTTGNNDTRVAFKATLYLGWIDDASILDLLAAPKTVSHCTHAFDGYIPENEDTLLVPYH